MIATDTVDPSAQAGSSAAMRQAMAASQLRTNSVTDMRVVAAMTEVAREDFLPAAAAGVAYRDTAVPFGHGRAQNPPVVTGRLLTEARITREDRVLLIGAATGYTAALLARLAGSVTAVESEPALAAHARDNVTGAVELVEGPLPAGHPDGAPYDVLMIDGAVAEVPEALWRQLAVGGRAVGGLVQRGVTRLASGQRSAGGFALEPFADMDCVELPGFAKARSFSF